eukprot:c19175_g1_i1 orf=3-233(-)
MKTDTWQANKDPRRCIIISCSSQMFLEQTSQGIYIPNSLKNFWLLTNHCPQESKQVFICFTRETQQSTELKAIFPPN